ncbi:hypothetical protein [Phocaeicola dorei]|uniref:hypothetical protein n=1 Tax=Phocaeicola dorei TaxID=357276 RepID=UPI001F3BAF87|nr:hypothetical protein [Phocaeicola dorei]MCE8762778.1 hypothetical protein [Phocaeicola dorei]
MIFSGMTDLLTDYSHYSIQTVSSRPEGVTDKTSVLGVSEVIFRASRKPRSTPEEWRQSAPGGRRL